MSKVIISISGGCLQDVHSDVPNIEVEIFDWDNIKAEREDMEEEEANTHLESREDDYNQAITGLTSLY